MPLFIFKKLRDIIFFFWGGGAITLWAISRDILRGSRLFWTLNLGVKKSQQLLSQKKIMSRSFLNSGTLVILCLFATMGPQFYTLSLIKAIIRKTQIFKCLIIWYSIWQKDIKVITEIFRLRNQFNNKTLDLFEFWQQAIAYRTWIQWFINS